MNLFVTGGTGFIGCHFVKLALNCGHKIVATTRNSSISTLSEDVVWRQKTVGEIRENDFEAIDVLVHLACVGVPPKPVDYDEAIRVNLSQSHNCWMRAVNAGVRRIIITGTALEYGQSADRFVPTPVDAPLEPIGAYAVSKAASSLAARDLAITQNVELAYLRIFNLYGEGQYEKNFYAALMSAAKSGNDFEMTSGKQVRDFVDVESAARKLLTLATSESLEPGKPLFLNFGSGAPKSLAEYARLWWLQAGASGKLKIGALPDRKHELMSLWPQL